MHAGTSIVLSTAFLLCCLDLQDLWRSFLPSFVLSFSSLFSPSLAFHFHNSEEHYPPLSQIPSPIPPPLSITYYTTLF
ncbi:hypothetical protein F5Y17DRAFT_25862 [Xylariaceae sp. FL0594]|nr:hypothetical protein F5Y17DRAFT_25862 [Xylariaceae sp. FL0594]